MTTSSPSTRVASSLLAAARAALAHLDLRPLTRAAFAGEPAPSSILAAGKCAGPMIDGALAALAPDWHGEALAIAPDGTPPAADPRVRMIRAAHPFPDERVVAAADEAMRLAALSSSAHPLWFCLSGGASACLGAPAPGLSVDELARITRSLMLRGASIEELNAVRKRLCRVVGGKLGAAAAGLRAAVAVDIADERVGTVASGPTLPDENHPALAADVLRRLLGDDARAVLPHLLPQARPPPWPHRVVAAPSALRRLVQTELSLRLPDVVEVPRAVVLPEDLGRELVAPALGRGGVFVAVGEVPFVLPEDAPPGGRCAHAAVWLVERLRDRGRHFALLCLASDGRDGPTDTAGALVTEAAQTMWTAAEGENALNRGTTHELLKQHGLLVAGFSSPLNLLDVHVLQVSAPRVARGSGEG